MRDGRRQALRRRYLGLGCGELTAAAVVVLLVVVLERAYPSVEEHRVVVWCAAAPLLVVLLQAGAYWLAARRWVALAPMPAPLARAYRLFRVVDVVLLAVAGLVLVLAPPDGVGAVLAVGLWGFGVVEYVNYFVVRLAYPVGGWWSGVARGAVPTLVRDLRARS